MKKFSLLFLALSIFCYLAQGQGELTLKVQVVSTTGKPLGDIRVWMEDKSAAQTITQRTDAYGYTTFVVSQGYWTLNLVGLLNYSEFPVYDGSHGSGNVLITYDLKEIQKEQAFMEQRNKVSFTEVDKTGEVVVNPKEGYCVVKVKLESPTHQYLKDLPVSLVSNKQGKIYRNKTSKIGIASFLVPINDMYAIDVNEMINYTFTGDINREGIITLTLQYEPTNVQEVTIDNKVTQTLPASPEPTSARSLFQIVVRDDGGSFYTNEYVYLQEIHGSKVYVARTNNEGLAEFLLPNGRKYMINFEFAKDVDVVNLSTVRGRNRTKMEIVYRPDPRLQHPEEFIPKPDELFLEEFQSFMDKQLPDPGDKKVGLYLKWGNDKINNNTREAILQVDIAVTENNASKDKAPPVNIAFVIDKSGSMAGYDRIESLKESMVRFVDELRPDDHVALFTFNTEPFVEIPMQTVGDGVRMKQIITEVEPGGGTNIYNGMVMGYESLLGVYDANKTNQLILLTDGYGITEPKIVVSKSKEYNAKGIGISAVGVGEDYNSALLQLLTEQSGGLMQHVGSSEDMYNAFKNQLSSILFPMGLKATLEIIYNDKIVLDNFFGMPIKEQKDNKIVVDIGDLYAGLNKVTLAQFKLNLPDENIKNQPVTIKLTYFDIEKGQEVSQSENAILDWSPETGKLDVMIDYHEKKLYAIAIMNQSIKVMVDAFAEKDYEKAAKAYERAREQLKELFPDANDKDVQRISQQMTVYAEAIVNYQKNQAKNK